MTGNPTTLPALPPSVLGSATNYCIGNRLDYQSFDNASELFRVARRASLGTPFAHPISPSLPFPLRVCVCVCVCTCSVYATANYLLRRSMNSNRNYISSDIQLEAEGGRRLSGAEGKKVRGQEQRLKAEPEAVREKRMPWCRGVHPLSRQTRRPSSPARALTLALVPIPCFGVEIFRNPDNVRVRRVDAFARLQTVDSFRFGNVCTRIRIRVSYFSRFYYPVFEKIFILRGNDSR